MFLLIAGWLGLSGGPLYWTLDHAAAHVPATIVQLFFSLGRALQSPTRQALWARRFRRTAQAGRSSRCSTSSSSRMPRLLSLDAIVRSLIRRFITASHLLEWETAAEAEAGKRVTPVDRYLAILASALRSPLPRSCSVRSIRSSLWIALPVLLLWGCASAITAWLNRPPREALAPLKDEGDRFLREQYALRIWRYFYQFGGPRHHYLIPTTSKRKGLFRGLARFPHKPRASAQRAAGSGRVRLAHPPRVQRTAHGATLKTLDAAPEEKRPSLQLVRHRDARADPTHTVSSVDSGNFAASLYTLRMGTLELLRRPLLDDRLFAGLAAQSPWREPGSKEHSSARGAELILAQRVQWVLQQAQLHTEASARQRRRHHALDEPAWWQNEERHPPPCSHRNASSPTTSPGCCPQFAGPAHHRWVEQSEGDAAHAAPRSSSALRRTSSTSPAAPTGQRAAPP